MVKSSQRVSNNFQRLRFFTNTYQLTRFYRERRNVYNLTIYSNVLVTYKLTSSSTSRCNTQTEHYVVQTTFKALQQDFTSNTVQTCCFLKHVTELFLQHTVSIFSFLLFSQHDTVFRSFSATVVTMLSRRIVFLRQNFICSKDCFTEFTCNSSFWSSISSHFLS